MLHTTRAALRRALLILSLGGALASGALALAQPPAQQGGPTIYLPRVAKEGKPSEAPPQPSQPTQPTTPPIDPVPPTATPVPPTQPNGFFAIDGFLTYNAATAVDGQAGVHMAFYTSDEKHQDNPRGQPAYYTYCPGPVTSCADGSNWSPLVQFDSRVSEVQIVVTPDGRPRLLVRRDGSRGNDYHYWACEQQCTDAANWGGLVVTNAMGTELFHTDTPQHSFALDSQGRPRFVYSNSWGNGRPTAIYYTWCDAADCTEPGSWQETNIHGPIEGKTVSSDYTTLAFDGDQPRVVTRINISGLPYSVDYMHCELECDNRWNWSSHTLFHPENKMWSSWDLALDAQGQPQIALYEPASIDITVGGKLFYVWCDNGCDRDSDFHPVHVASGEGKNVDLAIDPQGRINMIYDAGQRGTIGQLWCDTGCSEADVWQRRILETSEQLMQEFAPANPFSCDQQLQAWFDAVPVIAFDPQGQLVVAYDIKNVSRCYYTDPTAPEQPPGSRVERLWWAVRWAHFNRP